MVESIAALEDKYELKLRDKYPEYFFDNWWGDGPMPERYWNDKDWADWAERVNEEHRPYWQRSHNKIRSHKPEPTVASSGCRRRWD